MGGLSLRVVPVPPRHSNGHTDNAVERWGVGHQPAHIIPLDLRSSAQQEAYWRCWPRAGWCRWRWNASTATVTSTG